MRRIPRVKSAMTPFPHSVTGSCSLEEARQFLMEHRIRHLPVTESGMLAGLITDRDIKLVLGPDFAYPDARGMTVRQVMVKPAYTVDLNERLDVVLTNMAENHIGSAIVTRQGKLAGIFTTTDACRSFASHLRDEFAPPSGDEAA